MNAILENKKWYIHLKEDLIPFWNTAKAIGQPIGNAPTFRYDNGEPIRANTLKGNLNLKNSIDSKRILTRLNRQYTRMLSRQGFGYGVAYHMTGNSRFLLLAKKFVDYIFKYAFDEQTGKFTSYFLNGAASKREATFHEASFCLLAPAFYYYLTRDSDVLAKIVKAKEYIFQHQNESGLIKSVNQYIEDLPDVFDPNNLELVVQLDQINAYLLLLSRILPEQLKENWRNEMSNLAMAIVNNFYSSKYNLFWGRIDNPGKNKKLPESEIDLESMRTDYGHTVKCFANLDLVARYTKNKELLDFLPKYRGIKALEEAFSESTGTWSTVKLKNGKKSNDTIWWILAKMNEACAMWSLEETKLEDFIDASTSYWLEKMVDKECGEVYHMIEAETEAPRYPKAHLWKNAYHSHEHALVLYLVSKARKAELTNLFFAPKSDVNLEDFHPYYFSGTVEKYELIAKDVVDELQSVRITFSNLSLM